MVIAAALSFRSSLLLRPVSAAAAASRSKPRDANVRRPTKPRKSSLKARPDPVAYRSSSTSASTSGAAEATTYTRLPPKDDFSSLDPSTDEIKLNELPLPELDLAKKKPSGRNGSKRLEARRKASILDEIDQAERFELDEEDFDGEAKLPSDAIAKKRLFVGGSFEGRGKCTKSSISIGEVEEEALYDEVDEYLDYDSEDDEIIVGYGADNLDEDDTGLVSESGEVDEEMDTFLDEDTDLKAGVVKEKGLPAIMRCFDRAKVYVKAGDGGNGVVAFRREKFVPLGGPSGGDGGRGGNVFVEVDGSMNSLLSFRKSVHFRAGRGRHGQGMNQAGAKGEDVVVKVAPGTVIREATEGGFRGEVLLEMMHPGQRALLLPGGRGGRGNASFKSGTNKVPKIAEKGEKGPEMWLDLELKLVADVGIVGAPNAGKSTLLSAISSAQPAIANYPFTTLLPNLGVVSLDFDATMVVADLPGLLEGAHRGFGLGHEFLRHTERCLVLVHVVDGSGQQPEYEFDAVRLELESFSPELAEKPYIVVYNKMDLSESYERWNTFKELMEDRGIQTFGISAMNRQGTGDVVDAAYELLRKEQEAKKELEEWPKELNLNHVADTIQKQRRASMNEFEIFHDSSSNTWHVSGAGIQRFVQMTNWQYSESLRRFQHVLEACGVNKTLIKLGVEEGDTVVVGEMEMVWNNEPKSISSSSTRKRMTGSVRWPPLD